MIKKIIYVIIAYTTLPMLCMQQEPTAPPLHVFVNIIALICPDRSKQEENVKTTFLKNEGYYEFGKLGVCYLQGDLDKPIRDALYAMLEKVPLPESITYNHETDLYVDDQRKAPPIFCAFCTTKTKDEANMIYEHIKKHFQQQENPFKNPNDSWYSDFSSTKLKILMQGLDLMFNNERRNTVLELCTTMHTILKEGKEIGAEIILTANMSSDCCRKLLETNKLDDLFKEIRSSDTAGALTSQKKFYEKIIQEKDIQPHQCLVIDEHEENLIEPKILGMQALYKYKNEKFHDQLKDIITLQKFSDKK